MALGANIFRKTQIGLESTPGTAVPATAILLGMLKMKPNNKIDHSKEDTGTSIETLRTYETQRSTNLDMDGELIFEQVQYLLRKMVKGGVTATTTTGVSTWTFARNFASKNNFDIHTVEFGNDVQAYRCPYVLAQDLELSFAANDNWKYKLGMIGQGMATNAFTGAISMPTGTETAIGPSTTLYIDSTWAGLGGTAVPVTLKDGSIKIKNGVEPDYFSDGSLSYQGHNEGVFTVDLDLTVGFNTASVAEYANYLSQTTRFVRLKVVGSNIPSSTPVTARSITFDMAGRWTKWSEPIKVGASDVYKISMHCIYDTTGASDFKVVVVNGVPTLI